jgi:OmpA-OmpF porin, OOP family
MPRSLFNRPEFFLKTLFLAAAALAATASVYADPFPERYFGINLATPGEAHFDVGGRTAPNDNHPHAAKLYAGLQLSPTWAAEVGYGNFGSWRASDPTPGSTHQLKLSSQLVYVAARGTIPLGDSLALFSKFGLALNRLSEQSLAGHLIHETYMRPMAGAGLQWKLTPQVSATVEYAHYGSRGSGSHRFTQQKAEMGLVFKF